MQKGRLDAPGVEQLRGETLITVSNVGKNSISNAPRVGQHGDICLNTHIALLVEQKQDRRWQCRNNGNW